MLATQYCYNAFTLSKNKLIKTNMKPNYKTRK